MTMSHNDDLGQFQADYVKFGMERAIATHVDSLRLYIRNALSRMRKHRRLKYSSTDEIVSEVFVGVLSRFCESSSDILASLNLSVQNVVDRLLRESESCNYTTLDLRMYLIVDPSMHEESLFEMQDYQEHFTLLFESRSEEELTWLYAVAVRSGIYRTLMDAILAQPWLTVAERLSRMLMADLEKIIYRDFVGFDPSSMREILSRPTAFGRFPVFYEVREALLEFSAGPLSGRNVRT